MVVPFNPELPIILTTDASPYGVVAVLSYEMNGVVKPIAFASRSLTSAEQNYAQIDREALAIMFGFSHFHKYLFGNKFTLVTDNKPVTHIFHPKSTLSKNTSARLIRYASYISGYEFEVKFKRGCENKDVDYLSRAPLGYLEPTTTDILINKEIDEIFT